MYDWYHLYRGSTLSDSAARGIGRSTALSGIGLSGVNQQKKRRGKLLAQAMAEGKLSANQLSVADMGLAAPEMHAAKVHGSGSGPSFGGFLSNLGEDIWNTTKGLAPGLYHQGKAIVQDAMPHTSNPLSLLPGLGQIYGVGVGAISGHTRKEIVDPTIAQYKYTYAGEGAPKGSSLLGRIYQHPLGPILDAATVASLGAGAAAKGARVAAGRGILSPENTLVRMGRTDTRSPLSIGHVVTPEGVPAELPRQYSGSPLHKGMQILTDAAASRIAPLGRAQETHTVKRFLREANSDKMAGESAAIRENVKDIVAAGRQLDSPEEIALSYAVRGINTPERIEASRELARRSLNGENPEGANVQDFYGLSESPEDARAFVEYKANLPREVEDLILNPTEGMMRAYEAMRHQSELGAQKLGVDPEQHELRIRQSQEILDRIIAERGGGGEEPPMPPEDEPPPPFEPVGPEDGGGPTPIPIEREGEGVDIPIGRPMDLNEGLDEGGLPTDIERVSTEYDRPEVREAEDRVWHLALNDESRTPIGPMHTELQEYGNAVYDQRISRDEADFGQLTDEMMDAAEAYAQEHMRVLAARINNYRASRGQLPPLGEPEPEVYRQGNDIQGLIDTLQQNWEDPEMLMISDPQRALLGLEHIIQELMPEVPDGLVGEVASRTYLELQQFNVFPDQWTDFFEGVKVIVHEEILPELEAGGGIDWAAAEDAFNEAPDKGNFTPIEDAFDNVGAGRPIDLDELLEWNDIEPSDMSPEDYDRMQAAWDAGLIDEEIMMKYLPDFKISMEPDQMSAPTDTDWEAFTQDINREGMKNAPEGYFSSMFDNPDEFFKLTGDAPDGFEQLKGDLGLPNMTPEEARDFLSKLSEEIPDDFFDGNPPIFDSQEQVDEFQNHLDGLESILGPDIEPELDAINEILNQGEFDPQYELGGEPPGQGPPDQPPVGEDLGPQNPDNYPISPIYVPDVPAANFKLMEPGWLGRLRGVQPEFLRGRRDRHLSTAGVTAQNLFAPHSQSYMTHSTGRTFQSGMWRTDLKAFAEQVAKRERDLIDQAFSPEILDKMSAKDETGEPLRFTNQAQVHARLGDNWVLVHDTFPIRWFPAESQFLLDTVERLQELQDAGHSITSPDVQTELERIADEHARDFVKHNFNARKLDGVAIPRNFYDYQRRIETATDPFDNAAGRTMARYLHLWRTLTLAYMPRWAVNTAIGSFILNAIRAVGPKSYLTARRLKQEGRFAEPELAGVELGDITGLDYIEPKLQGYLRRETGATSVMGEKIVQSVQKIEDYFRRAAFVRNLIDEDKLRMRNMGAELSNFEVRKGGRHEEDYINDLLADPRLVRDAIRGLNQFSYNFAALGPYERRYVRQFIPFWGWYKFISKLAYRLPVDYPGRTNVLANIGMLGSAYEQQWMGGVYPDWMKGVIPLGKDKGTVRYLSTMGMNPFSQIFNPFGPEGAVQGAVTLGQASPVIQSLLSAYGVDPLRGGTPPVSPQEDVGNDFFGGFLNLKTGRETDIGAVAPFRRLVMGLLRSAPQVRMAERQLAGGRSVYPESVPFIAPRVMPTDPRPTGQYSMLAEMFGALPKSFDVKDYQALMKKRLKYAKSRHKTQVKRLKKTLNP